MPNLRLETDVVDPGAYENSVRHLAEAGIVLPTFAQLAEPGTIPADVRAALSGTDPGAPDPMNLFRVHWHNSAPGGGWADVPEHLLLPPALTGVDAQIVVLLGNRFPMIRSHKVLAAYGCLAPRVITGQFDPTVHRALWPSTGNYCRGGVAISRSMGCRGVAILPTGMSRERFSWLEAWVQSPDDIVRTPGSESNVKEIYDECRARAHDPKNIVFNQFSEFGNYLVHYAVTGRACEEVFESLRQRSPRLRLSAFLAATGSAGTLAAGDYLKARHGSLVATAEALECPTLLRNGFGAHNIQGIGDKHVPLIHNVMNTDFVADISDASTDALNLLFNTDVGHGHLVDRVGVPIDAIDALADLGLSSICNVLASIKLAKHYRLGSDDVIVTIATDGAEMYGSELERYAAQRYPRGFDAVAAAELCGRHLQSVTTDHVLELTRLERERIFDLGYYTWVEQQGVAAEDFVARRDPSFWAALLELIPAWDAGIRSFNEQTQAAMA